MRTCPPFLRSVDENRDVSGKSKCVLKVVDGVDGRDERYRNCKVAIPVGVEKLPSLSRRIEILASLCLTFNETRKYTGGLVVKSRSSSRLIKIFDYG